MYKSYFKKSIRKSFKLLIFTILSLSLVIFIIGCTKIDLGSFSISDIIGNERPLTTNLNDAQYEIPFLDNFNPEETKSLFDLPRGPQGGFLLKPGIYNAQLQSYCLRAGTYGPGEGTGEGKGYIYAPLKGKQSDIISSIIRNSAQHPEIPQQDIQRLIWAVLARAKIENLSRKNQILASKLISTDQILRLNRNALDIFPTSVREKAMNMLPKTAYRALETENRIREILYSAEKNYAKLERAAVLTGNVPWGEGSRLVPSQRWSYHPKGYFINYNVHHYTKTEVTIFKPDPIIIERDDLNRITSLSDKQGNRLETDYDDTISPLIVPGDNQIRGYAFSKIRFISPNPVLTGEYEQIEMELKGWTYVGIPNGNGNFHREQSSQFSFFENLRQIFTANASEDRNISNYYANNLYDTYNDYQGRYQDAVKAAEFAQNITGSSSDNSGAIEDITDIGHYEDGLEKATNIGDIKGRGDWIRDHLNIVSRAWAYCIDKLSGIGDNSDNSDNSKEEFDPSDDVAVPGNTSKQLEGISLRSYN